MKNVRIGDAIFTSDKQFKLYKKSLAQGKVSLVTLDDKPTKKRKKIQLALEDLDKNHNWSWYDEVFDRNKDNLSDVAIWFRGTEITYEEMFKEAKKYMKAITTMGIKKGDEVPVCMKNSPELVYLLLAASKLGIVLNIFGKGFDEEYITEILNDSKCKFLFAHEEEYRKIKNSVDNSNIQKKVIFALEDSLKDKINPYHELDRNYVQFKSTINELKINDNNILNSHDFLNLGKNIDIDLNNVRTGLDSEFTITYTSGSTNTSRPKEIVHRTRSYITMGRFHDTDLSGLPSTKHMRGLVHIPPYSNTNLITCISDVFHQQGTITIEPVYDINFFLNSLMINKPCFAPATRCYYLQAAKSILFDPNYKNVTLPYLYIPTVVGEPSSKGELLLIERAFKQAKAGCAKVPFPLSPVKVSIGGGDCEHGGLFFTLYKSLLEKLTLSKEDYGLKPFALAELAILKNDKTLCTLGELGRLVSNSSCTMKEYKNNKEATDKFFVTDAYGNNWGDNNVWAYLDKRKNVHIKGRMGKDFQLETGDEYPLFLLNDIVQSNYKNVLSSEVVLNTNSLGEVVPTIHIEFSPFVTDTKTVLKNIDSKLKENVPLEIYSKICYRIRTCKEAYPVTGSGKRDNIALEREGISDKCIKIISDDNDFQIVNYNKYIDCNSEAKTYLKK